MTEAELQEQIGLQAKTIEDLKSNIADITKANAELQEKVKAAGSAPGGVTAEQFKALQEKAALAEKLEQSNKELAGQLTLTGLQQKFPLITDWSLVPAGPKEQMEAHAAKLSSVIEAAVKKVVPNPANPPKPGDSHVPSDWSHLPPPGGPTSEQLTDEQKAGRVKALQDAQKSGDVPGALSACLKLQPNGFKTFIAKLNGVPAKA